MLTTFLSLMIIAKEKMGFERGKASKKSNMVNELFPIMVIDFMEPFVSSYGMKYTLVARNYLSEWVEEVVLPNN